MVKFLYDSVKIAEYAVGRLAFFLFLLMVMNFGVMMFTSSVWVCIFAIVTALWIAFCLPSMKRENIIYQPPKRACGAHLPLLGSI